VFDRSTIYTIGPDEHLRFLVLQRAALDGCQRLKFAPEILHCNDWHTALLPMLLKTVYAWDALFRPTRTVLSIHNIGYQGWFDASTTYDVGGNVWNLLAPETRAGGGFNWLREGVRNADAVTTVSPTYAAEIATPSGGHGLDGVLRARRDGVVGILNGVDYTEWNPATDRYLKHHYSPQDLSGKAQTKRAFLDWLNLSIAANTPLLGMVTRLTVQKGIELLFDVLPEILATRNLSCVVLGSGEARYENFFTTLQQRFPERVVFHRGYSEELAHLIEAASDMFLMPSLYEPCGLNQPDVQPEIRHGADRAPDRRPGGLRAALGCRDPAWHRRRVQRLRCAGGALGAAHRARSVRGSRCLAANDAQRDGAGLLVGAAKPRIPETLRQAHCLSTLRLTVPDS
jgi:starch synthase